MKTNDELVQLVQDSVCSDPIVIIGLGNMDRADDGVGLDPSIDLKKSDSFGLKIVKNLTSQLNGTVETRFDSGTEFILKVPKDL